MRNKSSKIKAGFRRYFMMILGSAMVGFAISVFFSPNKIVSGGVSGIAVILFHSLNVPLGVSYAVINAVLLVLAWIFLGKGFFLNTVLSASLLTVFVQIFSYIPSPTDDTWLAAFFGSVLYGFGIGLNLIEGASTGGTDIVARLFQKAFKTAKIGTVLLVTDSIVILTSFIVFREFDLAFYGIMSIGISSFAINWLIKKMNISKLAFVVTHKGDDIANKLVSNSPRGVTIFRAVGGYTMDNRDVLMCALKEKEIVAFQQHILEIDKNAFIIFSEAGQIVGNGFKLYH